MNKSIKQNWFESPLVNNNLIFFHEQKADILNFGKQHINDHPVLLTPSYNSKPIEIQKNKQSPFNQQLNSTSHQSNKFDDINLPNMFSNVKIQKVMIQDKIDFQDSSVIQQQEDYQTPQRYHNQKDSNFIIKKNNQPDTTAKKSTSNFSYCQLKKSRPKQKGLRILSQKAYEIILRLNGATYKQVANILVQELSLEDGIDINGKDQQNIKRRVYDALNVLIALGVLKKDGRKIFGAKKDIIQQRKILKQKKQQEIIQKTVQIKNKIAELQTLKLKKQSIKALIKRNKYITALKEKINFPYIAVFVKNFKQENIEYETNKFLINVQQQLKKIKPFGDVDSTLLMRNTALRQFIQ